MKLDDKVKELDALAEKATDSEWHPTFQAKTEFQNALVNAWRTWLREAALNSRRYETALQEIAKKTHPHICGQYSLAEIHEIACNPLAPHE